MTARYIGFACASCISRSDMVMDNADLLVQDAQAKPMYLAVIDALNATNSKL